MKFAFFIAITAMMLWHPYGWAEKTYMVHPLYIQEESSADLSHAAIRDHDGFLWVATDNGLKRYDGYHFKVFTSNQNSSTSLGSNIVTALTIQSSGALWAAGKALNLYHPKTETFSAFHVTNNATIRTIYEDQKGHLWLGGDGFGLKEFDTKTKKVINTFFDEDANSFITAITPHGTTSSIWLATNSGLFLFDTKTHEKKLYPVSLNFSTSMSIIRSIIEDKNGNVWLATHQGLTVLNLKTNTEKSYTANPDQHGALKTNTIWSVFEDKEDNIWVGTDKQGAYIYQPKTDNFLHIPSSLRNTYMLPPSAIEHIFQDNEGTVWFSTGPYGIYRISDHLEKFKKFQHGDDDINGISFDNILDLLEDKNGNIWIATDGGGLDKYNPQAQLFTHYKHDPENNNSISSNSILSLAEDAEGNIWAGTWAGGINQLNPKTGEIKRIKHDPTIKDGQTLENDNIFRIEIDSEGLLYLSLWSKGLQIYNPDKNSFESYFPFDQGKESGISNLSITDILKSNNHLWIAGHSGLELFDTETKTFSQIPLDDVDAIFDLHLDQKGTLWIASSNHLIRYHHQTKATKYYSENDGLADNFTVSIEEDDQGNLWIGTRNGLNKFNPTTEEFFRYDEKDGLPGNQFNLFSHLKTKDGTMYFGGINGLSSFNPQRMPSNETAPKVHITSLEIFQNSPTPGQPPRLDKYVDLTENIELPHFNTDITFEFTALNFISPSKNKYRYRLVGLEDQWIDTDSNRRRIRYTNLAPGKYTFQVLGSNNDGVWSGSAVELKLTILPAWWQTWWAKALMALCLLLLMYSFSIWRLRLNNIHQKQLEATVKDRTQALKQANQSVVRLNSELEQRVEHRTKELSNEIEERRLAERRSSHLAFHDTLTGLANRAWLLNHLEDLIEQAKHDNFQFSLFFIGGDKFKQINDTHGHLLGDMLLVSAAQRLKDLLPANFHAARLGSDEFTVVIDRIESEQQVLNLAQKIIDAFKEPFTFEQANMNFGVSIGMLICSNEHTQATQILRNADIAMNQAKSQGRGIYQMFDEEILNKTLEKVSLQVDLQKALEEDQFKVVFQPIVIINTGELSGFEILLRWHHPERGLVPPDQFIPVAEELGIIFDIGLWVLEQACYQLNAWHQTYSTHELPTIAVNLSPLQLGQADLLSKFDHVFEKTGVLKDKIKLEITESALMENTEIIDKLLNSLRKRGIELAIDDFGTGYSSLSYLDKLPVQLLKIDRSFVNALFDTENESGGTHEIVRATIALAHNLNMRVVAEGIETQEQMDSLSFYKCDYGQGYMISRPLTPEDATAFLAKSVVATL